MQSPTNSDEKRIELAQDGQPVKKPRRRWTKAQVAVGLGLVALVVFAGGVISDPINAWAKMNRGEGNVILQELEAYHTTHGEYPEALDALSLGFFARPTWGSWGYAKKAEGEFVLYLPFIPWLGDYTALAYRSDGYKYTDGTSLGDWQTVPGFQSEVTSLYRSYFP